MALHDVGTLAIWSATFIRVSQIHSYCTQQYQYVMRYEYSNPSL
jgi:hypothetical protein